MRRRDLFQGAAAASACAFLPATAHADPSPDDDFLLRAWRKAKATMPEGYKFSGMDYHYTGNGHSEEESFFARAVRIDGEAAPTASFSDCVGRWEFAQ